MVVDLTVKGWIPKSGNIGKLFETLKKLNLTGIDTVVIDSMSNTAFLGTDDDGLPIPAEKSDEDGRYHLNGDLQLAPPSAFKNTIKLVESSFQIRGKQKSYSRYRYQGTSMLPAATTLVMCPTARIRISCGNYPDPKSICLRPPQQAKGQQMPKS
jgi:hypothetical protein